MKSLIKMEYDGGLTYSIITSITTIIGPIITWLLARKKNAAEVDGNVIANMKESLDFYKQLSDDTRERLDDALSRLNNALKRNDELEHKVNDLQKQIMTLSMMVAGYGLQEKLNIINGNEADANKHVEGTPDTNSK